VTTAPKFFPPRRGDLPRVELLKLAQTAAAASPVPVNVHFKFTCEHCGERCTLSEPNMLRERGECYNCLKETAISYGGFMLVSA